MKEPQSRLRYKEGMKYIGTTVEMGGLAFMGVSGGTFPAEVQIDKNIPLYSTSKPNT